MKDEEVDAMEWGEGYELSGRDWAKVELAIDRFWARRGMRVRGSFEYGFRYGRLGKGKGKE